VDKQRGSESLDAVGQAAKPPTENQQVQLDIDDSDTHVSYSSTVRVWGTAEEINLDFAGPIRPAGGQRATLTIDNRVILNPYAAKRLALALGQAVQRYEQAYGELELDPRKRLVAQPQPQNTTKPN